ncbi:alpha/beta hydrolase [Candidatus Gottesmanbacteria bacterium]|nr:alpha/beta hydrolase [Candidatus Gottesmanbacteria bacterium]
MKPKALILQAWYSKIDSNFYPWLSQELVKKGYDVTLPDLPTVHTNLPDMNKQIEFIERLNILERNTIVFGHSLTCLLGMRLAEKYSLHKLFLTAGWDFDDLSVEHRLFWPNKIDHDLIKQHVKEIYCISSDNDPYITAFTAEEMSKRLGAKFILIKGAGHFTNQFNISKIPELLPYI